VEEHLLTHVGLRTLAPGDAGYRGLYRGGPAEREGAYHQGTVWPWLLGPFVRAYLHLFGATPGPPFSPGGAPAQAWSVAELLQTLRVNLAE